MKAYKLSLDLKTHTNTHLGSPLKNRETTLAYTAASFIQQVETNEQQSGMVLPELPSNGSIKWLSAVNQEVLADASLLLAGCCIFILQQRAPLAQDS